MNITLHRNTGNHEEQQTVNARGLHAFLEVGKDSSPIQVAGISDRNGQPYTQALITPKGLAKLAVMIQENQAA